MFSLLLSLPLTGCRNASDDSECSGDSEYSEYSESEKEESSQEEESKEDPKAESQKESKQESKQDSKQESKSKGEESSMNEPESTPEPAIAPVYEFRRGNALNEHWNVWLNSFSFGQVMDFSTSGSYISAFCSSIDTSKGFTLSLWFKAPVRETNQRILLDSSVNHLTLYLAKTSQELTLSAMGQTFGSGRSFNDGKWHQLVIQFSKENITFNIDQADVKTLPTAQAFSFSAGSFFIGASSESKNSFDGSLAELRFFNRIVEASKATDVTFNKKDNAAQETYLKIKKGIVIDRRQYYESTPRPGEGQTVLEKDIVNCINMGFDHVKLLLTPNHLIDADGHLKTGEMGYITNVLNYVKKHNYKCILCLHPEPPFKETYLTDLAKFELLINWYGEFARFIGDRWGADMVAIQLMTEPGANDESLDWNWMSDRMWGAVRNVLPDHTILTSSDRYGNLERLKVMSPATDSNLVYTFTTYEPYTIGWYYYNPDPKVKTAWSYVHDIPYPIEAGVDYSDAIEYAINQVPESLKAGIRAELWNYVNGTQDAMRGGDYVNHYNSLYNANWHKLRAKSLDDWSGSYGGNIHIMCVEFGCMDALTPQKLWKNAEPCFGISEAKRLEFTKDMRSAFDAYNIGWCYWSYNEAHTIFKVEEHNYGESIDTDLAPYIVDFDMLKIGLGIKPKMKDPTPVIDPDWLVVDTFESTNGWFGTDLKAIIGKNAPSGRYYVEAQSQDAGRAAVFASALSTPLDVSAYSDGYLHVWVYVKNISYIAAGQLELCNGTGPDEYETGWNLTPYITKNGWNELKLPLSETVNGVHAADLSHIEYIRLYLVMSQNVSQSGKVGIDMMYFYHE